jgi:Ca2+-binding RTX toxin-like protein
MSAPRPLPLSPEALDHVSGGHEGRGDGGGGTLFGTGIGDQVFGTEHADVISTGAGRDLAFGGAGDDMIGGGEGDDRLLGGSGDDTLAGGQGADFADGGSGNDTILWRPGEGNDTLRGGHDIVWGEEHLPGQQPEGPDASTDTLRLEMTGLTPEQLVAAMTLQDGSAQPVIQDGWIDVTGVSGSITIGGETIHFSQFERLELASSEAPSVGR